MRIVLDTNVLLSACWTPTGLEARLVQLAISRQLTAYVSHAVLAEYRDVLFRDKFAALRDRGHSDVSRFERSATLVEPAATVEASPDEDDNRFLECAAAANAEFLISRNTYATIQQPGEKRASSNAREFFDLNSTL